jgi:hypothetical protein
VCEAATGHIYRLPGENQFDVEQYRTYMDQLLQLGKVQQSFRWTGYRFNR